MNHERVTLWALSNLRWIVLCCVIVIHALCYIKWSPNCTVAILNTQLQRPFRISGHAWNGFMLPLIWINQRWPYAATEEWVKPWLGVPVLVSHNVCLLFCYPHILIRLAHADMHTHPCAPLHGWLLLCMTTSAAQQSMWNFPFPMFAVNISC